VPRRPVVGDLERQIVLPSAFRCHVDGPGWRVPAFDVSFTGYAARGRGRRAFRAQSRSLRWNDRASPSLPPTSTSDARTMAGSACALGPGRPQGWAAA
jgi:hypothetical protein